METKIKNEIEDCLNDMQSVGFDRGYTRAHTHILKYLLKYTKNTGFTSIDIGLLNKEMDNLLSKNVK